MCKTAVRTTGRYNTAVNHHLLAVERVKTKLIGEVGGWVACWQVGRLAGW